jgi:16S rRNA (guanine527-N7)-methyltransferase
VNADSFREAARAIGVALDPGQVAALARFRMLLEEGNARASLTAVTDEAGFWRTHALDSLSIARALEGEPPPATLVDVGAGAGIPAIPLAIAFPGLAVTAVEATAKKCRFMEEAARALGLADRFRVVERRAEEAARDRAHRERYDVATARAVSRLAVVAELCLPFVRVGGLFVAYKGPRVAEELAGAEVAAAALGARIEAVIESGIPGAALCLVKMRKRGPTPEGFPRRPGIPEKRPLGG